MIARIWSTNLVEERFQEYETFAHQVSIPMFKKQYGLLGVQVFTTPTHSLVVTLWNQVEHIQVMEQNPLYLKTVAAIEAQGFLTGDQKVDLFDFKIGFLAFEQLAFLDKKSDE